MAKQAKFYHQDTEKKLVVIEEYLKIFLSVMKDWSCHGLVPHPVLV